MSEWLFPEFPFPVLARNANLSVDPPIRSRAPFRNPNHAEPTTSTGGSKVYQPPPELQDQDMADADDEAEDDYEDPRNKDRCSKVRKVKSTQENLIHAMVRMYLEDKGLFQGRNQTISMNNLRTASTIAVAAFMNRSGPGPSADDIAYAWDCSASHPWNRAVVRILVNGFKTYATTIGATRLVKILGEGGDLSSRIENCEGILEKLVDIDQIISNKITATQQIYRTQMRKITSLNGFTDTEIKKTLEDDFKNIRLLARRKERKRNRFLQRSSIISEQLLLAKSDHSKKLWEEIELMFAYFKEDDMSSDETETERTFLGAKVVRRIRKAWIDEGVTKVLHYIDSHYNPRTLSGAQKRGSGPLKRMLDSFNSNTTHPPLPRIPANFYSNQLGKEVIRTLDPRPALLLPDIDDLHPDSAAQSEV